MNENGNKRGLFLELVDAYVQKLGYDNFAYVASTELVENEVPALFPTARQVEFESVLESCTPKEPATVFTAFASNHLQSPELEGHLERLVA